MSDMDDLFQLGTNSGDDAAKAQSQVVAQPEEEKKIVGAAPHLVEAFCAALSRLALGQRLYDADNKLVGMMNQRVVDAWSLINAKGHGVTLDVKDNALIYQDIPVFQHNERGTIATQLYNDGVRKLIFNNNLDVTEVMRFLSIFNKANWQGETDCADRIWILDLKGIRYRAVDGFDELVKETRGAAKAQSAAALEQLTGTAGALKRLSEEDPNAGADMWGQSGRVNVDGQGLSVLYHELVSNPRADPKNTDFWGKGQEHNGQLFDSFLRLMSYTTRVQTGLERAEIIKVMSGMLQTQLREGGGQMVERIEKAFKLKEPTGSLFGEAWREVVDPHLFTELIAAAEPGSPRQKALSLLMERYLKPSTEDLVRTVARRPEPESAASLIEMVHANEFDPMVFWLPVLDQLPNEILALIASHLTDIEVSTEAGLQFLQFLWNSPDPARLEMGIKITPAQYLGGQAQRLLACLDEPSESLRLAASAALRKVKNPSSGIYVLNILRRAEQKQLSPTEIRDLLHTLMVIGGDRYVPYLEQCLGPLVKKAGGFKGFGGRAASHRNPLGDKEVLRAAVRHGSPKALDLVKAAFNNGSPQLKSFISRIRQNPDLPDEALAAVATAAPPVAAPRAPVRAGSNPVGPMRLGGPPAQQAPTPAPQPKPAAPQAKEAEPKKEDGKSSLLKGFKGFMRRKS